MIGKNNIFYQTVWKYPGFYLFEELIFNHNYQIRFYALAKWLIMFSQCKSENLTYFRRKILEQTCKVEDIDF